MKAVIRSVYGSPDILELREVDRPVPKSNELLVKVEATTVNRTDCAILQGSPLIMRLFTGLRKPTKQITGTDFAGIVVEAGKDVRKFAVGDRLFGFNDAGVCSHAEYMVVHEEQTMIAMPENMSFVQAVACAEGAHYAFNFINKVSLQPGQKALVNGATGAIGSSLLQILVSQKVQVTAVCNGLHADTVKNLGADHIIDYTSRDFTTVPDTFDYVFDTVGKSRFVKSKPVLKENGIYISSELGPRIENPWLTIITSFRKGKKVRFPFPYDVIRSLRSVKALIEQGQFKPLIDRSYHFNQIKEAFTYVASGQKAGAVILTNA